MTFIYDRKIHFADTDSAGVVYFAQLLSMCHEAYEAYLESLEIDLHGFFQNPTMAIPIVHGEIDFFSPLFCGDTIQVYLKFIALNSKAFEIEYTIEKEDQKVATGKTRHVCINPQTRKTQSLPFYLRFGKINDD
ncbi:acyl-CoA thioesterase [Cyanobacterium stanieri LEGE 03274]|uniref:Acyl-CoA thioesterase n=1 Tax=Cyanobacterium stanieri LEGE 03274 TaxID=1828756 RepID=A0ABR9V245_9CHRO|nr:thioesterase family protein [Cyanobacterium stanieri]MBE9221967.1 acyl-CoA thioesterase [Cyanobacterium stanieri LEGE 03274]